MRVMGQLLSALLLCAVAKQAVALEGEARSHLQRLLADEKLVPQTGSMAALPVRDFGQIVWALVLADELNVARTVTELGLRAVDLAKASGRPAGALPPTLRADGTTQDPRYLVDAQAVAAVLEAAARYANALPEGARGAWLDPWWPQIAAAANFVAGWSRGPRGAPFPAYDPRYGRDIGGVRESMGALLAIICAQELAALGGKLVPETWQQRRNALEALVRTTDFRDNGRGDTNIPWGIRQLRGILAEDHPLWASKLGNSTVRDYAWLTPGVSEPAQMLIAFLAPRATSP